MSRIHAAFAALLLMLSTPAAQADQADAAQIRQIIEAQTAAITAGDGHTAFGYATPMIQRKFGSSATFMMMVETGYPILISPRSFEVESVDVQGDEAAAAAHLVARDGHAYKAIYPLKRQANGVWKIDGCYIQKADGVGA